MMRKRQLRENDLADEVTRVTSSKKQLLVFVLFLSLDLCKLGSSCRVCHNVVLARPA